MIPYRVIHTRNKHSHAIFREEEIVIRLARNLSTTDERAHIDNLLRRMARRVTSERQRILIDPFRPLLEGQEELNLTLTSGRTYRFQLSPGKCTHARFEHGTWHITVNKTLRRRALHQYLWRLLSYKEEPHIEALVLEVNAATVQMPLSRIRLGFTCSQWGSCGRSGRIKLSTALLFVPEKLQMYVILHELCHCVHQNHSRYYWQTVARHAQEYNDDRKELGKFRICRL